MIDYNWYNELTKPYLSPPSWVFTPVWIILYIMILSSLIIYLTNPTIFSKTKGYIFFAIQIILNLLWSPAFFVMKNIGLALAIIILMDITVFFTIKHFYRVSKFAAYLLIPYLIWILFATYLNLGFLLLN